jgi:hypothetical protein
MEYRIVDLTKSTFQLIMVKKPNASFYFCQSRKEEAIKAASWMIRKEVRSVEIHEVFHLIWGGKTFTEALQKVLTSWEALEDLEFPSTEFLAFEFSVKERLNA